MRYIFLILFVNLLFFSKVAFGQKRRDYYYSSKDIHGMFHLSILDDSIFEYSIYKGHGLGDSFAFGKILEIDDKYILRSQLSDFPVTLKSVTNHCVDTAKIWVRPIFYNDSSVEYSAFLVIDDDTLHKIYVHGEDGALVNKNFSSFSVEVKDRFLTQRISQRQIKGNEVSIQINTPFIIDYFLYVINNNYFKILSEDKIELFDQENEFVCTMESKQQSK
ncbi:hypothetical protein QTN47_12620 [Danxiaibacter flavus]|uniref:Uncharacterized protein n=1 Tax=Danxiaibacter flavus TaxID=3049108 RepID=A0ABV3ZGN7_9BACT|nr:hypothetical protein QNM32_12625 [Chitinophagaceae bacterium DXS]